MPKSKLECYQIKDELWREYDWIDPTDGLRCVYRIDNARQVYLYTGCRTHRVVDKHGVAHCVPAVGLYGCVLRWQNRNRKKPVSF